MQTGPSLNAQLVIQASSGGILRVITRLQVVQHLETLHSACFRYLDCFPLRFVPVQLEGATNNQLSLLVT